MKYKNIKTSIIIPVYNVEQYLSACLDSVISQTYENIEIVCVNDGSADDSLQVLEKYAQKDKRIKIINQKNQGVSVARNVGLDNATGDYIYFLDSDDYIDKNFIETSVDVAIKNDSDIVIVAENAFNSRMLINIDFCYGTTWCVFIKKDYLDKHPDIRFQEGVQLHEDAVFVNKLCCLTCKINKNPDAIYYYRDRDGQETKLQKTNTSKNIKLLPKILDNIQDFYEQNNLFESRNYYLAILLTDIIVDYWTINFSKEEKEIFFNLIKNFIEKNNIKNFKSYNFKLANLMARKFIECKKWQDYEKYLFLINFYVRVKRFFVGRKFYNA